MNFRHVFFGPPGIFIWKPCAIFVDFMLSVFMLTYALALFVLSFSIFKAEID